MQILGKFAGKFAGKIAPKLGFFLGLAFAYAAGDSLANLGATFTRASTATYIDSNGVLQTAASGVPRDGHYISGVRTLLLEGQRTNSFLNSGTPATHTSPSLVTGSYTLWLVGTGSIAVAAGTATITGAGTATAATPVTFTVTVAGTVTFTVTGSPTRAQCENGAFASSYIATAGSAVTRSADSLSFPWAYVPQAGTFYGKFVELGSAQASGNARIFEAANTSAASPQWTLFSTGGKYEHFRDGGGGAVTSLAAAAPSLNDVVELRGALNADGSVVLGQALNGNAEAIASTSAASALPAAWSAPTVLSLGGINGGFSGFAAFQSVKIALGPQSLATMRGL